ncbi:MAG: CRTAC1 family protein [Planctomycetes bacterium]|nr:CRTAC1 family protein [Planctomycetota bacterium]
MRRPIFSHILTFLALVTVIFVVLKALGVFHKPLLSASEIADKVLRKYAANEESNQSIEKLKPLFTDVAGDMGLQFTHDNAARGNFYLPEEMGPGAGFLDYDNDGDLDIFIAGGGTIDGVGPYQTCRLFRNDGEMFVDVTDAANATVTGPAYGIACADFDNDGDVDIFISRLGPNAMLLNDGNGGFVEVAQEIGVANTGFGAGAAFLDYDRDGNLDLYVTNYVSWTVGRETPCYTLLGVRDYCNPQVYNAPSHDNLYRNNGDGTFEDVSESAGIAAELGNGLGVLVSDFNNDGWPDIYVANDQTPAFYWINQGDGTFENGAQFAGCAYDAGGVAIAGMGTAGEDLDKDGDIDIVVTNIREQMNLVLRNDQEYFQDVSSLMGMSKWSVPSTTFGLAIFDQDNDGNLDGYFVNGKVNLDTDPKPGASPYAQPNQFVRLVDAKFVDATKASGIAFNNVGRALAKGDFDNDGDIDLLVTNNGGPVRLLRNNTSNENAWLMIDARLGLDRRSAIGARVIVTIGDKNYIREIRPQQSYLSSGDHRVHFGLNDAEIVDRVVVHWPNGQQTTLINQDVNQLLTLHQDQLPMDEKP